MEAESAGRPRRRRPAAGIARAAHRAEQRIEQRRTRAAQRAEVLASGLLDRHWIGLQLGRELADDHAAVDALLDADEREGPISPHPLVELSWAWPGEPWLDDTTPSLLWFLRSDGRRQARSPHPLIDVQAVADSDPAALRH